MTRGRNGDWLLRGSTRVSTFSPKLQTSGPASLMPAFLGHSVFMFEKHRVTICFPHGNQLTVGFTGAPAWRQQRPETVPFCEMYGMGIAQGRCCVCTKDAIKCKGISQTELEPGESPQGWGWGWEDISRRNHIRTESTFILNHLVVWYPSWAGRRVRLLRASDKWGFAVWAWCSLAMGLITDMFGGLEISLRNLTSERDGHNRQDTDLN